MLRLSLISIVILLTTYDWASCQYESIKNGAYRNSVDFSQNEPLYTSHFNFIPKNHKKIPNLYKVKSENKSIKKGVLDNVIWAIFKDQSLYLNAERIGMKNGYIKIEKLGEYSYFRGVPVKSLIDQSRINNSALNYGLIGVAATSNKIKSENTEDIHYVLCLKSGMINLLSKNYMLRILRSHNELLYSFEHEENNETIEVQLRYLEFVNRLPE